MMPIWDATGHQVDLEVGANVIGVRVTGHDGVTERTYTVTVTRAPAAGEPTSRSASSRTTTGSARGWRTWC